MSDWRAIWALAILGLSLSSTIIGTLLYVLLPFIGFDVPLIVTLLFWVIISATDPVAVLAIFKSLGAPKRLALLFEWESLFNDGTAVALFLVLLGIMMSWSGINPLVIAEGLGSFLSMVIGWVVLWSLFWVWFAKGVGYIKNSEWVEIVFTIVLAHLTFVLSEMITHYFHWVLHIKFLWVSGVIATVVAGIIMWNYWKYKVTPKVERHVSQFWELAAFISNSIVFILIWLIVSKMKGEHVLELFWVSLLCIVVVATARAISVYSSIGIINSMKVSERIPRKWQHILSWWSLRWSLALMMVLLIPGDWETWYTRMLVFQDTIGWQYDFSIKDFLLIIVISCIMFTMLVKATTIGMLMRKTKVSKLQDFEKFEFLEGNMLMLLQVLTKLEQMHKRKEIPKKEYELLKHKYTKKFLENSFKLKKFLKKHDNNHHNLSRNAIILHSLWAEKIYLKELFLWNEIGEKNFRYILRKIEQQILRLSTGKGQLRKITKAKSDYNLFQKLAIWLHKKRESREDVFIRNRARKVIIKKVIAELQELHESDLGFKQSIFKEVMSFYEGLYDIAEKKVHKLHKKHKKIIQQLDIKLAEKSLISLEGAMVEDMYAKWIISDKLHIKFKEEIEAEFYSDVKEEENNSDGNHSIKSWEK